MTETLSADEGMDTTDVLHVVGDNDELVRWDLSFTQFLDALFWSAMICVIIYQQSHKMLFLLVCETFCPLT